MFYYVSTTYQIQVRAGLVALHEQHPGVLISRKDLPDIPSDEFDVDRIIAQTMDKTILTPFFDSDVTDQDGMDRFDDIFQNDQRQILQQMKQNK